MFSAISGSALPKRLLRHALSRMDLLDTDAIDIDNLDLAIGRNTVLEFRDVGLKLEKLDRLLQLPSVLQIRKARVRLLRVSIPMDFYTSPVVVSIQAVEISVSLFSLSPKDTIPTNAALDGTLMPNAAELAQSFLNMQSPTEKRKLEEALTSASSPSVNSPRESDGESESESDGGPSRGTGQPLSLPGFLAGFLQGIVDRIQVSISDVTFSFETEVSTGSAPSAQEHIGFMLQLDSIDVEGVTTSSSTSPAQNETQDSPFAPTPQQSPPPRQREGKRHISLNHLRAYLVSDPCVFSMFSSHVSPAQSTADLSRQPSSMAAHPHLYQGQDFLTGSPAMSEHWNKPPASFNQYSEHDSGDEHTRPSLLRNDSSSDAGEDLTTSRMFTHDDAESLYLSVASLPAQSGSSQSLPATENDVSQCQSGFGEAQTLDLSTVNPSAEQSGQPTQTNSSVYVKSIHMPGGWDDQPHVPGAFEFDSQTPAVQPKANLPATPKATPVGDSSFPDEPLIAGFPETDLKTPKSRENERRPSSPLEPPRMAKEILALDRVSVFIPSQMPAATTREGVQKPAPESKPASLDASFHPQGPGAFSMYNTVESLPDIRYESHDRHAESESTVSRESIDIELSALEIRVDATVGFLLFSVISKLMSAFDSSDKPDDTSLPQKTKSENSEALTSIPSIKLSLEKISLLLLNQVHGFECFSGRIVDPDLGNTSDVTPDILLRADVKDIMAKVHEDSDKNTTIVSLGKVSFGYAQEHILWFEPEAMLQASIRDTFLDKGADIELTISKDHNETRMTVFTLPVYTKLDIVKLDDLLGWFGGIPGILSMSSSMASSFSAMPSKSPVATPKPKVRGVRFHEMEQSMSEDNTGTKTDIRIGGARVRLAGKSCRFDLDTSSIKVVLRDNGIRTQISRMQLIGPCTNDTQSAPITLQLKDLRLDFLNVPLESDIDNLLEMLIPRATKFKQDDDVMIDTLCSQRRKGPLLRAKARSVQLRLSSLPLLANAADLGTELEKLAVLAKLLPEDDRPGIMTMAGIDEVQISADVGGKVGILHSTLGGLELVHVGFPFLLAAGAGSAYLDRNGNEVLVDMVRTIAGPPAAECGQAIRFRIVGDNLEPVVKVCVQDIAVEYRVPTIMDLLDLDADVTPHEFEETLAASVASLGDSANASLGIKASQDKGKEVNSKAPLAFEVAFRDTMIGLNPLNSAAKMYVVLNDCRVGTKLPPNGDFDVTVNVEKAGVLLTDNVNNLKSLDEADRSRHHDVESWISASLNSQGYASVSSISSAVVRARSVPLIESGGRQMLVDMEDALLILETCADSTQTLIGIGGSLAPPRPPSTEIKYRTAREVEDLLASISGEAFGQAEGDYDFESDFGHLKTYEGAPDSDFEELSATSSTADLRSSIPALGQADYSLGHLEHGDGEKLFDATSMTDSLVSTRNSITSAHGPHDAVVIDLHSQNSLDNVSMDAQARADDEYGTSSELVFEEDYFERKKEVAEHARLWDTKNGCYSYAPKELVERSPVRVTVRNVRLFWKMFDGYDWSKTRDVITEAVVEVQNKALERQHAQAQAQAQGQADYNEEDGDIVDDETEIGDFLFNSIYIGIAPNQDPGDLASAINRELGDNGDTESVVTSATQTSVSTIRPSGSKRPSKTSSRSSRPKALKLQRSRGHKIAIEAMGIDADVAMLPPNSGTTQSCIDIRVKAVDVIDYMPGSTWRKFATYNRDAGERELDSSMIHIEVLTVNPVPSLPAYEFVVSMQILPLRLHVDQDALDFVTRFFSFKDSTAPTDQTAPASDPPFVSRFEIQRIPLVLDFKPRRVDYAALRSGKTSEFMNFVTLQDTHIELRRIMLHGVPGFDRVGQMLNDLWTPDVKRFQLATVLAGLSVVRPLADVGNGLRDLVEVPIMEYRKDGRILRSIGKGAISFVRNTGTGVVKLGAKVAVGTQNALEGAEGLLSKNAQRHSLPSSSLSASSITPSDDPNHLLPPHSHSHQHQHKVISPYANQPLSVVQGLRGGYTSLSRDISMARDAIVAVSTQVMESQGAAGAAKAVLEAAPTIIFRPVIGASKAIGQTLLGATNTLDPANRRRVEDVSHIYLAV
ncbi:hypothetical protein TD95_000692 [Thielaviopsis punctulata]|uniref:Autophagy-related protein 2 n=1 Tax=Thielaviopsis punctulata TaxID=72032 RepID=A0A0F4ZHQ8_9PEZI|nr:hypothetical protein TD95_000692 [Thielaviopsis punctulata]